MKNLQEEFEDLKEFIMEQFRKEYPEGGTEDSPDEKTLKARHSAVSKISMIKNALKHFCEAKGVDSPCEIFLENESLEESKKLLRAHLLPKNHLSKRSKRQIRYYFNCLLKHHKGKKEEEAKPDPKVKTAWEKLVPMSGRMEPRYCIYRVRRMVRWYIAHDIMPEDVDEKNSKDYCEQYVKESHHVSPRKRYAAACRGLHRLHPDLFPREKFYSPSENNKPYSLKKEYWPEHMRNGFEEYMGVSLEPTDHIDIFAMIPDEYISRIKKEPSTIKSNKDHMERYAGFMVNIKKNNAESLCWEEMYKGENMAGFLRFLKGRKKDGAIDHFRKFLDTMKAFATVYLICRENWDEKILREITRLRMVLPDKVPNVNLKEDVELYKKMFVVADGIRKDREDKLRSSVSYSQEMIALQFQYELAIRFLLNIPLRPGNFVSIEIGEHLIRNGNGYKIDIPGSMVKNGVPVNRSFPDFLLPLLEEYLSKWRPILLGNSVSKHLIINSKGAPISTLAFRGKIRRVTRKYCGIPVTPHRFRALYTAAHLDAGADVDAVADALGHKTTTTIYEFYDKTKKERSARQARELYLSVAGEIAAENGNSSKTESNDHKIDAVTEVMDGLKKRVLAEFGKIVPNDSRIYRTVRKDITAKFKNATNSIKEVIQDEKTQGKREG